MYIVKNAFKSISRSKGRNLLIGVIALVIAVSACIGLSIRQAAEKAKQNTLDSMSITATISINRNEIMNNIGGGGMGRPSFGGGDFTFDRDELINMMGQTSSLTLEEYETYAKAESVAGFYYTVTIYMDGDENLDPYSESSDSNSSSGGYGDMFGGMPDFMGGGKNFTEDGEFSIVGYSTIAGMSDFVDGISTMTSGSIFDEGTTEYTCIISEELALFNNNLVVGDEITFVNPNSESETYTLKIVGIFKSSASSDSALSRFNTSQDPFNKIYMSAAAVEEIVAYSTSVSTEVTDEDNNRTRETKLKEILEATYVFAEVEHYENFEEEVRALGLSDSYTVSSSDLTAFENSLIPLKTLSGMAGWFLVVILLIGSVILIVLNIFNVRERKYEIGVLTAMGMKKGKVAIQFICEILVITMLAVVLGAGIGAVSSVPVTNALLENQAESQNVREEQIGENLGVRDGFQGGMNGFPGGGMGGFPGGSRPDKNQPSGGFLQDTDNYITEINSAMDLTVVLEMIGIGLLLTLVASMASVLFVMRYDPLKILANRD